MDDATFLSPQEKDSLEGADRKAIYLPGEDFQVLSLRSVELTSDGLGSAGLSFLIRGQQVFLVENLSRLTPVDWHDVFLKMNEQSDHLRQLLLVFAEQIDELEDVLFERKTPRHFLGTWFQLKKDLSAIDRAFTRNAVVLKDYLKKNAEFVGESLSQFHGLINHLETDRRTAGIDLSRLEAMFHYFTSLKSEKMNENIYLLAIVSGIFLPLNLVVGFFGINTQNLFFHDDPYGTFYVLWLISGLFGVLLLGLPTLRLIDRLVFKTVFGQNHLYRSIHRRINRLKISLNQD